MDREVYVKVVVGNPHINRFMEAAGLNEYGQKYFGEVKTLTVSYKKGYVLTKLRLQKLVNSFLNEINDENLECIYARIIGLNFVSKMKLNDVYSVRDKYKNIKMLSDGTKFVFLEDGIKSIC